MFWADYFYVSVILVGISTVWILINFVTQLVKVIYYQEIFKSISLAKEHALCGRCEHLGDPWRINVIDSSGRFHSAFQLHVQP